MADSKKSEFFKTTNSQYFFEKISGIGPWGITRLDLMAYLDPASNPGSKQQRFSVKKRKSSTPDKLQTIRTIFGNSCKLLSMMRKHFLFSNATAATLG